jgi:CheY-like chemotaxis protein
VTKTKILVVEDERIIAMDIQDRLRKWGYDAFDIASSGEEALRKTKSLRPDLVLMDIKLQGEMDGIEAAKKIQAQFNIPIIYLTAYADERTLARAEETQPSAIILKPFGEKVLQSTIQTVLNKQKLG